MNTTGCKKVSVKMLFCLLTVFFILGGQHAMAMSDEDCLECHSEEDLTVEQDGKIKQLYVDGELYKTTIHAENGCISCHEDADVEEAPHPFPLSPVKCENCHDSIGEDFSKSLHGKSNAAGNPFAPTCSDCHGKHNIFSQKNEQSKTFVLNVPSTCGGCHYEDTDMAKSVGNDDKLIVGHYSGSLHGKGLFNKGLAVTAVCSSCHTAHKVLPPDDPDSSISRDNIIEKCTSCHASIKHSHADIIRIDLWEEAPQDIPVCVECHNPHKKRKFVYRDSLDNETCLECHGEWGFSKEMENGVSKNLHIEEEVFSKSIHGRKRLTCRKCHVDIDQNHIDDPGSQPVKAVDCSRCHAKQVAQHKESTHGQLIAEGNPNAPNCTDCHGKHNIMSKNDMDSPSFARNIPKLCAGCHQEGQRAALRYQGDEHEIIKHYTMSIHGKGLEEAGLIVSASCTSCHTAHSVLPADNPKSSVNRNNVVHTCGNCHLGIADKFAKSIHSPVMNDTEETLPVCNDCHTSHTISRHQTTEFRLNILEQCGNCHEHESETYLESYHGRASMLAGGEKTAKCSDCHGSHDILPPSHADSKLSSKNSLKTCQQCHPDATEKFTSYLTHASHNDKENYPYLFYTFWAMTGLLLGTFAFFGIHTILWIPRSFIERAAAKRKKRQQQV
jgi:predicted CXXCH cytochrome family protein